MIAVNLFNFVLIFSHNFNIIFGEVYNNFNEDTILQVHVSFRHGDRTMNFSSSYPTDPNRNIDKDMYPLTEGQLTNIGKQRAYKLGKMLRKRYNNFLGELYDSEIVKTLSTDFDRSKMTAQLVLAGLFPPSKVQQWDDELLWQPIPVDYQKKDVDTFLRRQKNYCPKYMKELKRVLNESTKNILTDNKELIEYIEKNSGQKIDTLKDLQFLFQTTYIEEKMNLTLPDWMQKIYPEPLGSLASHYFQITYSNTHMKRLNGGHIWKKILMNFNQKINETLLPKGRKIYLYSGHRKNAINLLATIDLWDTHLPNFCAATIVELVFRNHTNEYGVKIYYHDQISENPKLLTVPGCKETFCEYNKFVELTKPIIPQNYTTECGSKIDIDLYP